MNKLLPALLLIAACSDTPTDVTCTARGACEVDGIDLAVVSMRVDSLVRDDFRQVLDAGNIDVEFMVVNRGDEPAAATDVVIDAFGETAHVGIRALAPGDSVIGRAHFEIERAYVYFAEAPETRSIKVAVLSDDADPANNTLNSQPYALNIPFVTVVPVLEPHDTLSLATDGLLRVSWNYDVGFAADVERNDAVGFLICLRRGTATCTEGNWQALARENPERFSRPQTAFVFITPAAAASPITGDYQLMICTVPRTHTGMFVDLSDPDHHCEPGSSVTVRP